jgi:hypothetical protein
MRVESGVRSFFLGNPADNKRTPFSRHFPRLEEIARKARIGEPPLHAPWRKENKA